MKQEQLFKSIDLIKEYNDDLFSKLRSIDKIVKGKLKTVKEVSIDQVQEVLILISILLLLIYLAFLNIQYKIAKLKYKTANLNQFLPHFHQ